jgi:hypothetical protein
MGNMAQQGISILRPLQPIDGGTVGRAKSVTMMDAAAGDHAWPVVTMKSIQV